MPHDFYLEDVSANGLFQCILESDECSIWMYLHDLTERVVVAAAPVGSLMPLLSLAEFRKTYQRGGAPPLVREYSTDTACLGDAVRPDNFKIMWGRDGVSVALVEDSTPIAIILAQEKKGFSKAVRKSGPWGEPWDQQRYEQVF